MNFDNSMEDFKRIRARYVQRKVLKFEFELFTKFENHTRHIWALYQQSIIGNINVPKLNYMEIDEGERSWMWRWINGNEKWHAWNKLRGYSKDEAKQLFIEEVTKLKSNIHDLDREWRIEMSNDPEKERKKLEARAHSSTRTF